MSKELWEQQLDLWQTQDKMNELHTQRIDELTKLVQELVFLTTRLAGETLKAACTGKQCRCGKVAH